MSCLGYQTNHLAIAEGVGVEVGELFENEQ